MAEPIDGYEITEHAAFEMQRRHIGEQRYRVSPGREVLQSRIRVAGKPYLLRVFVDVDRQPPEVVTVYRTSRVAKYWRIGS
jgi:hypothetical protein